MDDVKEVFYKVKNDGDFHKTVKKRIVEYSKIKVDEGGLKFNLLTFAAFCGKTNIVKLMVEKGQVSTFGPDGMTALHLATLNNHQGVVKFLLEKGLNINTKDDEGLTALHVACRENSNKCLKLILENGSFDVNEQVKGGFTPLHFAVFNKNFEAIDLLLAKGANTSIEDEKGRKAFDFEQAKEGETLLLIAYENNDFERFKLLLRKKEIYEKLSDNILKILCKQSKGLIYIKEIAQNLSILLGIKPEMMRIAFDEGCWETLKYFAEIGASPCDQFEGTSLLHLLSSDEAYKDILTAFVENPAIKRYNIDEKNSNGHTALQVAALNKNTEGINILSKAGANLTVANNTAGIDQKTKKHTEDLISKKPVSPRPQTQYSLRRLNPPMRFGLQKKFY